MFRDPVVHEIYAVKLRREQKAEDWVSCLPAGSLLRVDLFLACSILIVTLKGFSPA